MMPVNGQAIELRQGEYRRYTNTIEKKDGVLDLRNFTLKWVLYRVAAGHVFPVLVKLSTAASPTVTVLDASQGTAQLEILSEDTKDLDCGSYYWEFQVIDRNNQEAPVSSGTLFIVSQY